MAEKISDVIKKVYKPGHGPANEGGEQIARGILHTSRVVKASKEQQRKNRAGYNETRALARTRLLESRRNA